MNWRVHGLGSKSLRKSWSSRRWSEIRQALLEFNRSLTLIADPETLVGSIASRISELFGTDRIIVLRAFSEAGLFTLIFSKGFSTEDLKNVRFSQQDHLAKWLLTNETILVIKNEENVLRYLSSNERGILKQLDVRVCVPLLVLNGLTGLILLSSTDESWSISQEDLSLLQMLMSQATIAFENAYLYQQQRDRLRRLYRAERLAAAGQLAASVAHEIRNPLTSIRSTVQYLLGEFDEESPKRELVEAVISEVDRIDRTVDGLLSLTRTNKFTPERILFSPLIEQSLLMVRAQAHKQNVDLAYPSFPPGLYVLGDVSQLKQLLLNLMLNSLQAMPDGGRLEIKLEVKGGTLGLSSVRSWADVEIRDTGCGIPSANLDKIFDPFFTTKQGGTGLGLSTSYAIAKQHSCEIEIDSHEGEGTRVTIRFPLIV